jgi:putative transposase
MGEAAFFEAYVDGDLRFLHAERDAALVKRKESGSYYQELSLLDGDGESEKRIKREFLRKFKYVKALEATSGKLDKAKVKEVIETVSEAAGQNGARDPKPPSWKRLLYGWYKPYEACGSDFRVLIPGYAARGNRAPRFTGVRKRKGQKYTPEEARKAIEIAETITEVKNEVLADSQRATRTAIVDRVQLRIREKNEFRSEDAMLPFPSGCGVYAFLGRNLNQYEKDKLRYGEEYAENRYRENKQGPILSRPLQRTEIDHTLTDLMVIDTEVMLPIGRPHHTSSVDCFTTMGTGFYSSFNCPGWLAVMQCLKHAILPKTYVRERYPSVRHDWDCYGIPELVVVDNGPEFHGDALDEASVQIGFEVQYGGKGMPWYRATVERHFRTKNEELLHRQPGTTFSNILDKGDYDPVKNAIIPFDDYMEMAHIYTVDIYPWESHGGLKVDKLPRHELKDYEALPGKLWGTWIDKYPPSLPPHRDDLLILLGELHHRTISSSGVALDCLQYNCAELAELRRKKPAGEKFKIKNDPNNLSAIYVEDLRGGYIYVPALNQEYTRNLTLWQHTKIKEYARKKLKRDEEIGFNDLLAAKQEMQDIVDRCWARLKNSGARKLMARFKGIGQEDYGAGSPAQLQGNVEVAMEPQTQANFVPLNGGDTSLGSVSDLAPTYPSQSDSAPEQVDSLAAGAGPPNDQKARNAGPMRYGTLSAANSADERQRLKSPDAERAMAKTVSGTAPNGEDDEELDLSEFSADYDLP